METRMFARFGGWCAILAGIVGLGYSIAFVIISRSAPALGLLLSALCLLAGALLSSAALVAVYERVRDAEPGFALWGLALGLIGATGAAQHGAFDLSNAINPPITLPGEANLPSQADPRGFMTFAVAGLAVFVLSWLMRRSGRFPGGLGQLGYVLGALLIVVYLGRLIILDPSSYAILLPAALVGFILNPIWYIWTGVVLSRQEP